MVLPRTSCLCPGKQSITQVLKGALETRASLQSFTIDYNSNMKKSMQPIPMIDLLQTYPTCTLMLFPGAVLAKAPRAHGVFAWKDLPTPWLPSSGVNASWILRLCQGDSHPNSFLLMVSAYFSRGLHQYQILIAIELLAGMF